MNNPQKPPKHIFKYFMLKALPGMITCAEFDKFIIDYFEGTLPKSQRIIFDLHLKVCRECRDYIANYQLTKTLYTQKFQSSSESMHKEAPEDLIAAVIEASATDMKK